MCACLCVHTSLKAFSICSFSSGVAFGLRSALSEQTPVIGSMYMQCGGWCGTGSRGYEIGSGRQGSVCDAKEEGSTF